MSKTLVTPTSSRPGTSARTNDRSAHPKNSLRKVPGIDLATQIDVGLAVAITFVLFLTLQAWLAFAPFAVHEPVAG